MVGGVEYICADPLAGRCGRNSAGPADRQQEEARPRRGLAKQPPDIVENEPRREADRHEQQARYE